MAASKGNPTNPTDRVLEKRAPRGSKDSALPPRVPVFVLVAGALFAIVFAVATIFRVLPTPLYLLLGLSFSTAVIAYWSDQLGMKLGKKRISLFGLRPRQTATLISIGSSWLIMLFSVAVLLLIYAPLKDALLRYDRVNDNNKLLIRENKTLEQSIVAQRKNVEARSLQNAALSRKIGQQSGSLKILSAEIGARQTDLTRAKASLRVSETARDRAKAAQEAAQNARNEAENAKRQAESARQNAESGQASARRGEESARVRTAQAQTRFVQAQARYSQAQTKLSAATSQLLVAQNAVVSAQAEVDRAENEVNRVANKLSSTRSELVKTVAQVQREKLKTKEAEIQTSQADSLTKAALQQQKEAIKQTVQTENQKAQLEIEIATNRQQLEQLQNQLVKVQSDLADASSVLSVTATLVSDPSQTAMNAGQVLAAKTLPANSSEEKARAFLTQLVEQGRQNVQRDGWQSLYLAPISVSEGDKIIELNEEQIIPSLALYLSQFNTPASVRLFAARDHAKGETEIVARLLAYPVKTAFASGEVLAQTTIEVPASGAAGDAQIFNQLLRLVDRGGKTEAQKRGVVPLITVETPNFFAPDTNLRIFEAMRELQSLGAGRRATVKLVAADAISTVESPRVRFEVS